MADVQRDESGKFPAYAWPGGYPIFYLCSDGGTLCPECVNVEAIHTGCNGTERCKEDDAQWCVVASDVHWEGAAMICDHCNAEIESAYGEPDNEEE